MNTYEETQLIDWIATNMIATENNTIDKFKRKLFIELVEDKKDHKWFSEAYKKLEQIKIKEQIQIKELEEESQCDDEDCRNTTLYERYGDYDYQMSIPNPKNFHRQTWCFCKDCYDKLPTTIKVNFKRDE